MIVVNRGTVRHNGRLYGAGEIVTGLKKDEAQRLLKLGACREIADAPAAPRPPKKTPEPDTGAGAAGAQTPGAEPAAPEGASVGDLGLQVDPAATISK